MANEQKFVRAFDHPEVHLTACAVTKNTDVISLVSDELSEYYFEEPNQFWKRDPHHERALLKVYKRNPAKNLHLFEFIQTLKIPMPFLGHDSSDGWGELQFLIKTPRLVKLARHRSFDARVNQWVNETQLIQPKNDLETHAYLALRFYHQDHLPPVPSDWRFEPVYVSVRNELFYEIYLRWEGGEITVVMAELSGKGCNRIPKHLLAPPLSSRAELK